MAIIENFYNGDRARDIREVLTSNFANVAKYIPNNFISLTTTERQNLTDDYKTHFKLVFDKEKERVYRWSEIDRSWKMYLIYAWDEYARTEADTNTERAFAEVELGKELGGAINPYAITFYNRKGTAKGSILLTSDNIRYTTQYSVTTILDKLISDFNSLNEFIGDRETLLTDPNITASTVTSAIKEINQKTIDNKTRLDGIESGATVVPKAQHANEADHALLADKATDADKLGGQDPSYYATKAELDSTNEILDSVKTRVEKSESDIAELQSGLSDTNELLNTTITRVSGHDAQIEGLSNTQAGMQEDIETLQIDFENYKEQIGWNIVTE